MNAPASFIVVLNCGSSSIKFGLFDAADPGRTPAWNGKVQGIGGLVEAAQFGDFHERSNVLQLVIHERPVSESRLY